MSLNGQYTSIERVIENLYRDVGYERIDLESVLEWSGEAMDLIGVKQAYKEVTKVIEIEHYRGEVPCDLMFIHQTRNLYTGLGMTYNKDNFLKSSQYHTPNSPDLHISHSHSYTFDGKFFYTDFKDGEIEVNYRAFPTDERGFPLIPSDTKYLKAVESYIRYKMDYRLMRAGKLDRHVYEESASDWSFAAGQSKSYALIHDTVDKWESFKNQFVRLIPNITAHDGNFSNAHHRERRLNNPETRRYRFP